MPTKTLDEWWTDLSQFDREIFMDNRERSPLPAVVVALFGQTGQMIAGVKWESEPGSLRFYWPEQVQQFLRQKAIELGHP